MISPGSKLLVSDNSGARVARCIRVLGRSGRSPGTAGDLIVVSVIGLRKKGNIKVKKKEVCLALILCVKKKKKRADGRQVIFKNSSCILLNYKHVLYGTRIFGPVLKEFKKQNKYKLLSISSSHY
jgi:large subunit ribosomal protein L14